MWAEGSRREQSGRQTEMVTLTLGVNELAVGVAQRRFILNTSYVLQLVQKLSMSNFLFETMIEVDCVDKQLQNWWNADEG